MLEKAKLREQETTAVQSLLFLLAWNSRSGPRTAPPTIFATTHLEIIQGGEAATVKKGGITQLALKPCGTII